MDTKVNFFYCYDKRLRNLLMKRGQSYICSGLHQRSHKPFWQFQFSLELEQAIKDYNDKVEFKNTLL